MPPLPHRIRRLSLRVRATSPSQALALRKQVRDQLDTTLTAAMERAFDKAGAPDELIHIPRVHVRVRVSGKGELAGELARCIEQELHGQLSTLAAGVGRTGPAGETTASLQVRAWMLLHYLETGSLPWPLAQVDPAVAVSELRNAAGPLAPGVLDRLTGAPVFLPAQVAFWFRWLQLLPDASWPVLARAAAPPSSGQGTRLAGLISALSGEQAGALSRYARLQLAAAAIARARSHVSGSGDGAGEDDWSCSSDRQGVAEAARLGAAAELTARMPAPPAAAAFRAWPVAPGSPLHANAPESSAAVETGAGRARFGQRVHHAGLVLLHPFLPRFFESLAIKEADKPALVSGKLPRAATLLHRIAAGEEEVFEFELDFIKVLLGLPLESPLPVSEGLLLASDREEVEALLSAVIGHWRVHKNTSVRGLRSSFLQRSGLLREEAQGFRLQVEPASFDMLLGQLPWGIGTVKLPWMKKAIFTEWTAP
jgi:contractile injection system tape measure protein